MPGQHITWAGPPNHPNHTRHLPLYKHPLSKKAYLSPLLADRGLHRFSHPPPQPHAHPHPAKKQPRSPTIAPLNITLANTAEVPELYTVPLTASPCTAPGEWPYPVDASCCAAASTAASAGTSATSHPPSIHPKPPLPPRPSPKTAPDSKPEWPPCPLPHPHLHGDMNPHRPYQHHSHPPHRRQLRMLQEFNAEDIWEGGNPPSKVWDALFRVFLGEEEGRDEEVVFGWRYWHCVRFRWGCLGEEGRRWSDVEGEGGRRWDDEERKEREDEDGFLDADGEGDESSDEDDENTLVELLDRL